jgi:hypothetical protein
MVILHNIVSDEGIYFTAKGVFQRAFAHESVPAMFPNILRQLV